MERIALTDIYRTLYFWSQSFCLLTTGGAPIEVIKNYIENQGQEDRRRKK